MRRPIKAALTAFLFSAGSAAAQPVLEERLLFRADVPAQPQFSPAPPPSGFQTRIVRASIRDHLRDYRVRVLQDGFAVQKRFTIGR